METFEQKALDAFSEIVINKAFVHDAGFGSRAIPIYVREWIISHYLDDSAELNELARVKIASFVEKYVPDKSQKEAIKNQLFEQLEVNILDNFSVYVNLAKGDRYLHIPFLDDDTASITPQIVQDNEMLLSSGLWGVGTLYYIPKSDDNPRGQVWMRELRPFQLANLDLAYFRDARKNFSTQEWIDFLVSSMGFNPKVYSERQKVLLICRLVPMVEPRYNLVELAPKGTGKSFVFENMSRYVAVRSGNITPAVLFFNDARKTPGLITRFDSVVIDEAQKVKGDSSGELTALLKSYLESGRFGRGSAGSIPAEAGLVILANIELDRNKRPITEEIGLFRVFPNFLRETAFIDRFSGLLPGWDLPKINKQTPSKSIGLKGDIFGEILHKLRGDISYRDYVKTSMELQNCDDMRDSKGIEAGATGLLKILFPDKDPSEEDFYKYCVNPALEMRQRVHDELCKLDREYDAVTFKSKYPDDFQCNHRLVRFVSDKDIESIDALNRHAIPEEPIQPVDQEEAELLAFFGEKEVMVKTAEEEPHPISPSLKNQKEALSEEEKLIQTGENAKLEFKSTLRWNVEAKRIGKEIEHGTLKTIVAYLNTDGGTLLIGVQDDGSILGLDLDKFSNDDKCLLHMANLINDKIGKQFIGLIQFGIRTISNKKILRVDCRPSSTPVFLKNNGAEEFYVRSGPSSVQLSTSQFHEYSKKHFR